MTPEERAPQRPAPLYVVVDRCESTGRLRVLQEYVDPIEAVQACRLLRWAGSAARVLLVNEVRDSAA